jgi:hypothetical protein
MRASGGPGWRPLGIVPGLTLFAVLTAVQPAGADQVILSNGGLLSGNLELTEVVVQTQQGPVRIGRRDVLRVTLGAGVGDVVLLRNGGTMIGLIDQARYAIRLPSGQTVTTDRAGVATLTLQ